MPVRRRMAATADAHSSWGGRGVAERHDGAVDPGEIPRLWAIEWTQRLDLHKDHPVAAMGEYIGPQRGEVVGVKVELETGEVQLTVVDMRREVFTDRVRQDISQPSAPNVAPQHGGGIGAGGDHPRPVAVKAKQGAVGLYGARQMDGLGLTAVNPVRQRGGGGGDGTRIMIMGGQDASP